MLILRQSTAVDLAIGPFLDSADGNTVEGSLTITQPDVRLSKNGAAWAQKSAAQTLSHQENGYYQVNLSTTDTNTVGILSLHVHESGALPVFMAFHVVEEAIYDALFAASATGALPVSSGGIVAASFGAGAIDAAAIAANAIGASEIADGAIDAAAFAANAITSTVLADNAITAAKIATDAITAAKIAADAIGASEIADGAIDAATFAAGAITASAIAADAIGASELAADAVTEIQSGLATAANLQTVDDNVDAILVDTGTTLDGKINTIDGIVDDILLDTGTTIPGQIVSEINDVQADIAALNDLSAAQVNAEVDTALSDYDGPTSAELVSEINSVQADIAALNDITVADILAALKGQDRRGLAQSAGAGTDTLELAAGDSAADDFYNGGIVILLEGTGADGISASLRTRRIIDYVNATNEIQVDTDWDTTPDNTTVYLILGG